MFILFRKSFFAFIGFQSITSLSTTIPQGKNQFIYVSDSGMHLISRTSFFYCRTEINTRVSKGGTAGFQGYQWKSLAVYLVGIEE
ncbi:MAG TPA: hypothetical protein VD908_06915 [Cytophagales bacterium]|nr:hypothetical protein [Cytophagales bacterium]